MLRHEKRYCENCSLHGSCGYVGRGLEGDCIELGTYASGYEQALEDAKAVIDNDELKNKLDSLTDEEIPHESKFKEGQYIIHVDDGQDILWQPHKVIQVDEIEKKYRLADGGVVHFSEEEEYEVILKKPMKKKDIEVKLTDFEKELEDIIGFAISTAVVSPKDDIRKFTKEYAPSLLMAARKQLENEVAMMPTAPCYTLGLVGLERELDEFFVNRCDMYRMRVTKEEKREQLSAYAARIRNIVTNEVDDLTKKGILAINQVSYKLGCDDAGRMLKEKHEQELEMAKKNADEGQYKRGFEDGFDKCHKLSLKALVGEINIDDMVSDFNGSSIHPCDYQKDAYRKGINDVLKLLKGEKHEYNKND